MGLWAQPSSLSTKKNRMILSLVQYCSTRTWAAYSLTLDDIGLKILNSLTNRFSNNEHFQ